MSLCCLLVTANSIDAAEETERNTDAPPPGTRSYPTLATVRCHAYELLWSL